MSFLASLANTDPTIAQFSANKAAGMGTGQNIADVALAPHKPQQQQDAITALLTRKKKATPPDSSMPDDSNDTDSDSDYA